jgi:hypothetical protein
MTRKHFEALAAALKAAQRDPELVPDDAPVDTQYADDKWLDAVYAVTDVCASFNPNFDRARFLKACGVEEGR